MTQFDDFYILGDRYIEHLINIEASDCNLLRFRIFYENISDRSYTMFQANKFISDAIC